jgi:phosphoribosyl-AMP cyclohydrolase
MQGFSSIGNKIYPISTKELNLFFCVIQDEQTKEILSVHYTNEETASITRKTGYVTLWSRSLNRSWIIGEEAGKRLLMVDVKVACGQNSIIYQVRSESHRVASKENSTSAEN